MRKLLLATVVLLSLMGEASAQSPVKVFTSPKLPPRDALERMNLVLAWKARVSVEGNRDGIASIQLIPGTPNQVVVQTYRGSVLLFDADNGDLIWKTAVGVPFWTTQGAGFNSHSIYVTRRNMLHVLDRRDGKQRVFTYDPVLKHTSFGFALAFSPNAGLVADENFVYAPMGDRIHAVEIPHFGLIDKAKRYSVKPKKDGAKEENATKPEDAPNHAESEQPEFYWSYRFANQLMESSPLIYEEQLSQLTTDGTLLSLGRYDRGSRVERFDFKASGRAASGPGQHLHMAYIASDDFNLYAVNMKSGALVWRHASGSAILKKPEVTEHDIFIAPERMGLRRLDRKSGREVWTNRDASRFLAANPHHVYALDQVGQFYVLDARRGTTLAKLDLAEWTIPFANEWTDRVYLAANDGQIICLRHRDLTKAVTMKLLEAPIAKEEKKPKEEPKKDDEKDKDMDKEKDKEKDKGNPAAKKRAHLERPTSETTAPRVVAMTSLWDEPIMPFRRHGAGR